MKVTDFTVTSLKPNARADLKKLLPTKLFPEHCEFKLYGVNNAISNAIRRTIACELPVRYLHMENNDIKTDNMFIIPEIVVKRFQMIPILQNIPMNSEFMLDVSNDTPSLIDVKSSEIKPIKGPKNLPFNETFTLFTLEPGTSIKITNIKIGQDYGFKKQFGMLSLAFNAASIALDVQPINIYDKDKDGRAKGVPSSIANPKHYKLSFNTNGSMNPKDIVRLACDNIIERASSIIDLMYAIENIGDEYLLTINGESHTIGNLFMRTISDIYPNILAVTYSESNVGRSISIRIRCDEDIQTVYEGAIHHIVKTFTDIKKQII